MESRNIGQIELRTQYPIRLGADSHDERCFKGKISCVQFYNVALTADEIGRLRNCPVKGKYCIVQLFQHSIECNVTKSKNI